MSSRRIARRVARAGLAGVFVGALAGCGVPSDSDARVVDRDELPAGLVAPASTTTTPAAEPTQIIQLFYVRDNRLEPTIDEVPVNPTLNEVLAALVSGPDDELARAGYRSAIGGPEVVRGVSLSAGVATVDLTSVYTQIPVGDQVFGLGEIVLTLTAQPGVGQVRFTLEGTAIEVPRADNTTAAAVSRDDYTALLAP